MKTSDQKPYRQLVMLITTICDQECPRCCYRLGFEKETRRHFSILELIEHAKLFRGLDTIFISGGEPTRHPHLNEIIVALRMHMAPRTLCLATHGLTAKDHLTEFKMVDWVMLSRIKKGPARAGALAKVIPGTRVTVEPAHHREMPLQEKLVGALPCKRKDTPMYVDGRLYPCCVGHGLPDAQWIKPVGGWHMKLQELPLPCEWCGFSKVR